MLLDAAVVATVVKVVNTTLEDVVVSFDDVAFEEGATVVVTFEATVVEAAVVVVFEAGVVVSSVWALVVVIFEAAIVVASVWAWVVFKLVAPPVGAAVVVVAFWPEVMLNKTPAKNLFKI